MADGVIRLLDADPELGRRLSEDERIAARAVGLPLVDVGEGPMHPASILERYGAFGAIIIDGIVVRQIRVGGPTGLRLLGPGDLLPTPGAPTSALVAESGYVAASPTRLALLGDSVLVAARRWPRLVAGLYERAGDQIDRAGVQVAICQLPRVEDRILGLLWLLAESWGHVTPAGTRLPVSLTHETIGGLIGARRPTVTLALGVLTEQGLVTRHDGGWLLNKQLEAPKQPGDALQPPELIAHLRTPWMQREDDGADASAARLRFVDELSATIGRLRARHELIARQLVEDRRRTQRQRERSQQLREQTRRARSLKTRQPPS